MPFIVSIIPISKPQSNVGIYASVNLGAVPKGNFWDSAPYINYFVVKKPADLPVFNHGNKFATAQPVRKEPIETIP
jgi:hypothetical protein